LQSFIYINPFDARIKATSPGPDRTALKVPSFVIFGNLACVSPDRRSVNSRTQFISRFFWQSPASAGYNHLQIGNRHKT
jgi:hypothetical protein